jgi:F0F1-type ATP synthase assembly protein I
MTQKGDHFLIAGLGVEFALIMALGCFAGRWLDNKFGSSPVFLLVCCVLAFALAVYLLVKSAKATVEKKPAQTNKETKGQK